MTSVLTIELSLLFGALFAKLWMSDEGSSLNEKRDLKARNKHRKSLTSGALCRGFLGLKMCRLWVSSSPRDLRR